MLLRLLFVVVVRCLLGVVLVVLWLCGGFAWWWCVMVVLLGGGVWVKCSTRRVDYCRVTTDLFCVRDCYVAGLNECFVRFYPASLSSAVT